MLLPSELFTALQAKQRALAETSVLSLFENDQERTAHCSAQAGDLLLDFSKHRIDQQALTLLVEALESKNFNALRTAMLQGQRVNNTEQRAALHTALRTPVEKIPAILKDAISDCNLHQQRVVEQIRSGAWRGATGKRINTVVNIGIGGSDLGPHMATRALLDLESPLKFHFVSNIDPTDIVRVLHACKPAETLFVVSSKTFTTFETLRNASNARTWLVQQLGDEQAVSQHFLAVSSNLEKAAEFGIPAQNVFPMWDWVGGRYSLWSAIGLPLRIAIGNDGFEEFLNGANAIDEHFATMPPAQNIPVLMALLGVWYRNFWGAQSHGVICYEQRLEQFPAYLQQLEMESNGKAVTHEGQPVNYDTGAVLWGGVGSNTQHSFHQLLHQGTGLVPLDFIIGLKSPDPLDDQHRYLFANCLAQSHALMAGLSEAEASEQMREKGLPEAEIHRLAPHRKMPGNRPHSIFVYPKLTPFVLGQLIACYEHKVFCQSVFWDINPFDQYGVELGKTIGVQVADALLPGATAPRFDPATDHLINLFRSANP